MSAIEAPPALATEPSEDSARRATIWRSIIGCNEGRIGLALSAFFLVIIVFGPTLAPYPPAKIGFLPNQGVSSEHLMGTDNLGRDVLSRVLYGGRSVIIVPLLSVVLASIVGGGLGMLAGYMRGKVDAVTRRVFDLLLALPSMLLILVIIAGFGTSNVVLVLGVALIFAPRTGRLLRGATLTVVSHDYVAAAQARGERTPAILVLEVLPNIAGPAIAEFALRLTWAVIFVSTLSFLGLGAQPPSSNWGLMISQNQQYLGTNPISTVAPAAAIAILAVALNLVADSISRRWEPSTTRNGMVI